MSIYLDFISSLSHIDSIISSHVLSIPSYSHDYWPQDMSIRNWELINRVADSFNEDGVFTSLVGFEWTSDEADYGHELGRNHGKGIVVMTLCICTSTI